MKKNAILIAGIMFVAGCATHQGGYVASTSGSGSSSYEPRDHTIRSTETIDRNAQGEPVGAMDLTTAGQYDSANFHADSSRRGGSNEARGWRNYGRTDYDVASHPMNPAVQADSSIRGGSMESRNQDWNTSPQVYTGSENGRIKADSSIRGSSNEARGNQSDLRSDDTDMDNRAQLDMYRGAEGRVNSDSVRTAGGIDSGTAANWNPSDDLMRDGTDTKGSGVLSYDQTQTPNTSVWLVEPLDDMTARPGESQSTQDGPNGVGTSGSYQSGSAHSMNSPAEKGNPDSLNPSKHLEEDISGQYTLNDQLDSSKSSLERLSNRIDSKRITGDQMSTEDIGGPGSSETGSSSSSDSSVKSSLSDSGQTSQGGVTTDQENWLYRNNRAQGVGSTATGEFGVANSTDSQLGLMNDGQLAEKVKSSLVKESTGTFGITQAEARAIKVFSHNGIVKLKGSVPSEKDKKLVEIRVNEMAGVKRVDNQLTVSPNANPASRDFGSGRNLEDTTEQFNNHTRD
ncbi:MAG TPA: BON domain-containing protein [Verrucomicrobiae bacterium]|nr:BON domain-containing protein [Verrucomicrobiae bacterium]